MRQIAMASIKCTVSEENMEIIKRALIEASDWRLSPSTLEGDDNTLVAIFGIYTVLIELDLLPDSKGYFVCAYYNEYATIQLWPAIVSFCIGVCCFLPFAAYNNWVITKTKFGLSFACFVFFLVYAVWVVVVDGLKAKKTARKAVKKVSQIFS